MRFERCTFVLLIDDVTHTAISPPHRLICQFVRLKLNNLPGKVVALRDARSERHQHNIVLWQTSVEKNGRKKEGYGPSQARQQAADLKVITSSILMSVSVFTHRSLLISPSNLPFLPDHLLML